MFHPAKRGLLYAGLLATTLAAGAAADSNPSLTLAPAEITLDLPASVPGGDLKLLLARSGSGESLSALKEKAEQKFRARLQHHWRGLLVEFFADEEVPLVRQRGLFTLRATFDISIDKRLTDLKSFGGSELERGILEVSGDFYYRLQNTAGTTLRERRMDVADLDLREKYRVRTPTDGGEAEDSTDAAIEDVLSQLAERLLDRVEDDLEADRLRGLATL